MKTLRKPDWFKIKIGGGKGGTHVRSILEKYNLNTVCNSAECPNRGECYNRQVATFLIMGNSCTRGCRFCSIDKNNPLPLDEKEPSNIAKASLKLNLKHVVITSVTRDDLEDGGASHFVKCVNETKRLLPNSTIEVLVPDFAGKLSSVDMVCSSHIRVFNHNIETVKRLYKNVRIGANYERSLNVLKRASNYDNILVKSGFMVGLGENFKEIEELIGDLYNNGVRALTVGQYLQPSRKNNIEVNKYYDLKEFQKIDELARKIGFVHVKSAPLVRSSYMADSFLE